MRARILIPSLLALCLALPLLAQEPVPPPPGEEDNPSVLPPQDLPPALPDQPATTSGEPAVPPPVPAPDPLADPIEFNLKFPEDQGGGSASGSAGNLEYVRDNYAVLTGDVKIKYQDVDLKADRAEIDLLTKIVTATGHVIVDQGPRRMAGDTLEYDLDTKTG